MYSYINIIVVNKYLKYCVCAIIFLRMGKSTDKLWEIRYTIQTHELIIISDILILQ